MWRWDAAPIITQINPVQIAGIRREMENGLKSHLNLGRVKRKRD